MFTYAEVERALAEVHQIPESAMGALRGRIKNLQRLGITSAARKSAKRMEYELKDVYLWSLCLEMAQFGINHPGTLKEFAGLAKFSRIIDIYLLGPKREPDYYFEFYPAFLSKRVNFDVLQDITHFDKNLARAGTINLGHMRREVERALAV